MATTERIRPDETIPSFNELDELRPYPSLLLLKYQLPGCDEALESINLGEMRDLVATLNGGLPKNRRISTKPDPGKTRLSVTAMRKRIRRHQMNSLTGAIQEVLAADVINDKVVWELLRTHDLDPEGDTLRGIRSGLRGRRTWQETFDRVCGRYHLEPEHFRRRTFAEHPATDGGAYAEGRAEVALWYVEHRPPGWFHPNSRWLHDDLHQIVVVTMRSDLVGIYASEGRAKQRIANCVDGKTAPWVHLHRLTPSTLNAAFTEGPARTLWLRGIHRRTAAKPDSKILTGLDLESALDPLGDQTFYFSAARCNTWIEPEPAPGIYREATNKPGSGRLSVGVAPRRSTIWAPPVPTWWDYTARVGDLMDRIEYIGKADADPFAALAVPVDEFHRSEVWGAYDMSVIAPELLLDDSLPPGSRPRAERWAYDAAFFNFDPDPNCAELNPVSARFDKKLVDPNFSVAVALHGSYLGRLQLSFSIGDDEQVKTTVQAMPIAGKPARSERGGYLVDRTIEEREELLAEARAVCEEHTWLTVRYDSGHTMSGGALYSVRLRDTSFPKDHWVWRTFDRYDVTKEKPSNLSEIGEDDSLFSWVANDWPADMPNVRRGWLACDDGPEEIADFIHFDPIENLLTLIHVKASHSSSPSRQISTSDYEVVVGQAVKNLRLLDRVDLAARLTSGVGRPQAVLDAVWYENSRSTREKMVKALLAAGDSYQRRVVIVQPRVTAWEYSSVMKARAAGKSTGRVRRLRQLDTLLLEAQAACRHLGADFWVIGQSV